MRNEIILYTCGDSNDISTWSNVPYLFAKALEKKGYILHRVDISPSPIINHIFNSLSFLIFKRILRSKACPEFHRTWLHRYIVYRRLKKAAYKYPNASLNLFLSFAFINPYSNRPNILWCDWTDEISIERMHRQPQWYEKYSILHERNVMKNADIIYTMFPVIKKQMEQMYHRTIHYLNRNVVNTVYKGVFNIEQTIKNRERSNIILFIGNFRYQGAAKILLQTFEKLVAINSKLECHIIGMTDSQLDCKNMDNVYCYGYLHKNNPHEYEIYYSLLLNAKILINPAKEWGGYSSTIEAMYYGCPIIVSPYKDFVEEFGSHLEFGSYITPNKSLEQTITEVVDNPNYSKLCMNAYERVKDYTWDNYMSAFLKSLDSLLNKK